MLCLESIRLGKPPVWILFTSRHNHNAHRQMNDVFVDRNSTTNVSEINDKMNGSLSARLPVFDF
jgi:hypothetical protein